MSIDFSSELGQRALQHLTNDIVVWLTTVSKNGTPQPNPVWFVLEGDSVLIWVQPGSARMKHLAENPRVALNFQSDPTAEHIVVITGKATVDDSVPPITDNATYVAKYAELLAAMGWDPDQTAADYSVPLRISLNNLRGY